MQIQNNTTYLIEMRVEELVEKDLEEDCYGFIAYGSALGVEIGIEAEDLKYIYTDIKDYNTKKRAELEAQASHLKQELATIEKGLKTLEEP